MNEWTFPKKTCESSSSSKLCIYQPFSFLINLLILGVLFILLGKARTIPTIIALLCFILFEIIHAWSHAVHVDGKIQLTIIHLIGYTFFLTIAWCLQARFQIIRNYGRYIPYLSLLFGVLLATDLYFFLRSPYPIIQVFTAYIILAALIIICIPLMKGTVKYWWIATLTLSLMVFLQIGLEARYCSVWLARLPNFPFHIFVELWGLVAFTVLGNALLMTESNK